MQKLEKDRILEKLKKIGNYISELNEMLPEEDEYVSDVVKRRACEKTIELAIDTMVDVCSMIISYEQFERPRNEDDIIDLLEKNKIITPKITHKIKEMKGFRNILVHRYGDIDDSMSYEFMSNQLEDFREFVDAIKKFISSIAKFK